MENHATRARRQIAETSDRFLGWFVNGWILIFIGLGLMEYAVTTSIRSASQIALLIGLLTRGVISLGRTQEARWVFVLPQCFAVAIIPAFTSGVRSPLWAHVPLLILLTGWLHGRRLMACLTGCFSVLILGYVLAETQGGWSPPMPPRAPDVFGMSWVVLTALTAITARAMLSSFKSNVYREVQLQTELAESELQSRALLTSLRDGILLVNDKGRIAYANQQLCALYSLEMGPEALVGRPASEVSRLVTRMYDDPEGTAARLQKVVKAQRAQLGEEVTLKNGRTLLRDYIPFEYGEGRVGRLWHLRDVTALRSAQAQLQEANRQLETLSITDGLTGLANRRRFDQHLEHEWVRSQRQGQSLALILLDVDWFKDFNDLYGHQAGDTCLQDVAQHLQSRTRRAGDLAARYGGEEFALVLPDTETEAALALAWSIQAALRDKGYPHLKSPLGVVTVSLGVAVSAPGREESQHALLRAADRALYQAKARGRDRVESAGG